jgi:NADH:ubiquinone oxidoreductase subunit 5 (subunit L)/multisubunit Na+/H+ antiporter MnhA subunit
MGLPFLTGFYSKDTILELINCSYLFSTSFILALLAASFTSFYSFRLLIIGILKEEKGSKLVKIISLESGLNLTLSLIILTFMSLIIGFFSINFFKLESIPNLNSFNKQLPLIISFLGAISTLIICSSISLIIIKKNIVSQIIEFYGRNA